MTPPSDEKVTPLSEVFRPAALQQHATRYVFMPVEMLQGDPMDTAHLHNSHAITVEWRGGDRWAVMLGHGWSMQQVWNGDGWEWEPQPSSRDDDFFARCRFDLQEALSIGHWLVSDGQENVPERYRAPQTARDGVDQ